MKKNDRKIVPRLIASPLSKKAISPPPLSLGFGLGIGLGASLLGDNLPGGNFPSKYTTYSP